MIAILSSPATGIVLTLGCYLGGTWLYKKTKTPLLHPVITSAILILAVILLTPMKSEDYQRGGGMITFLLGPATSALAARAVYKPM